jgi:hypothetical protein
MSAHRKKESLMKVIWSFGIRYMLVFVVGLSFAFSAQASPKKARKSSASTMRVPDILLGSPHAMETEGVIAHRFGMVRYANAKSLRSAIVAKALVRINADGPITFDEKLGEMDTANRELYRYAQPQVKRFLNDLITDRHRSPNAKLKITSMVRTLAYQSALLGKYANAADANKSSHPTGATVDISAKEMSPATRAWLRGVLTKLEMNGLVQATEETGRNGSRRRPGSACFHIMVSPMYLKYRP